MTFGIDGPIGRVPTLWLVDNIVISFRMISDRCSCLQNLGPGVHCSQGGHDKCACHYSHNTSDGVPLT